MTPEDIKAMAVPVLAHRLILTPQAELEGTVAEHVVERVLASTVVPQVAPTS